MASCLHASSTGAGVGFGLHPPKPSDRVHKEECTQCFSSQDGPDGINVCLSCFNGGCTGTDSKNHSVAHFDHFKHPFALNIKRVRREGGSNERPQKITKLAIEADKEEEQYEYITRVLCFLCGPGGVEIEDSKEIASVVSGVMAALSSRKQSDVKAWSEEITSCEHTRDLIQPSANILETQNLAHCNDCDLKENLWLCLVCGNLGCGRQQYGGTGGNGHGISHFEKTGHVVSCKLGTITPEGTADIFCYSCQEDRLDPNLSEHLRNFGINITQQQKTEKSIAELQLEQNLKFDFSMVTEDGKEFAPLFGPGYTGLKNLGNTCYMASVLQILFHLSEFQARYLAPGQQHLSVCKHQNPAECYQCQMAKMCDGLISGRYSVPILDERGEVKGQDGISPFMFKSLLSKGHPEFATMRQQDAEEYFQHIIKTVQQSERASKRDPSTVFQFDLERRLECERCHHVRYSSEPGAISMTLPVPAVKGADGIYKSTSFDACLQSLFQEDSRSFNCPVCKTGTTLKSTTRFVSYPDVLITPMSRFVIGSNYVMEKLNVFINTPEHIDIDAYRNLGRPAGEAMFPEEDSSSSTPSEPSVDESFVEQLTSMGFPRNRCVRALVKTGNNGPDVAMNWLFEHMDDPDIDEPLIMTGGGGGGGGSVAMPSEGQLQGLMDMGFTMAQAKRAMMKTNNDMERAVDWLFSHPDEPMDENIGSTSKTDVSTAPIVDTKPALYRLEGFISHKGTSAHCGHYVVHLRKDEQWVLFNDNKVVAVPDVANAIGDAYIYMFRRMK